MSEENGKVCCNCRHNIRTGEEINIECHCDIDGSWLSYITVEVEALDMAIKALEQETVSINVLAE